MITYPKAARKFQSLAKSVEDTQLRRNMEILLTRVRNDPTIDTLDLFCDHVEAMDETPEAAHDVCAFFGLG